METELIDRARLSTRADAEREVFSYIEGFYNPWRHHSANGQLSPIEHERRHIRAAQDTLAELSQDAQNPRSQVSTELKQFHGVGHAVTHVLAHGRRIRRRSGLALAHVWRMSIKKDPP